MSTTPPRAPRPQPKYSYDVHGQGETSGRLQILKDGIRAMVKKPSWKGTETVFRPYPSLRYDDPSQIESYRLDPGGRNFFGNWIRRYDCWWGVGREATTILISNPETQERSYDKWSTPLGVLYRAVEGACKQGQGHPEWYALREGGAGRGKALRPPGECYLMQGVMLCHNSQQTFVDGKAPWGWGANMPLIFVLSQGIGCALEAALNEERDGYRGDPSDFEARYKHGDPVALDRGRYFHFFEKGHDPRNRSASKPVGPSPFSTGAWGRGPAAQGGGKSQGDIGFDLFIDDVYAGFPAAFPAESHGEIVKKWLFWEDVLYFPSVQEQARRLFEIFPLSACMYAFETDHKDWIPEEKRKEWYASVSASVPAGAPGGPFAPPQSARPAAPAGGVWGPGVSPAPHPQYPQYPQYPQQPQPAQPPQPQGTGVWGQPVHNPQGQPPQSPQPPEPTAPAQPPAGPRPSPFSMHGTAHTDSSVPDGDFDGEAGDTKVEDVAFFGDQGQTTVTPPPTSPKPSILDEDAAAAARMLAARNRR